MRLHSIKDMSVEEMKEMSVEDTFSFLSSSTNGLSSSEAKSRLDKFGFNEIPEKKINPYKKFLLYFWGPIPWMIEAAAIISAFISHWGDFWIIVGLLILNGAVGFWQEHKAGNAIALLKQRLALKTRVFRDGKWIEISAKDLVIGDVIRVRLGDIVPADIKLIDGNYLFIDESILTGESLPVEKHVSDLAYSGSVIQTGEMNAIVVTTGIDTYFGKTVKLVEKAKTQSHFQKAVLKIGDYLIGFAIALVVLIFLVTLFRHEDLLQTLQFALVLLIAAIPAALPAVLSVTMAVGSTILAKKKQTIVSKLTAIEEMSGMDILFCDKTGTLTKGEITVSEIKTFDKNYTDNDIILFAALASREENKDPIDMAIIQTAKDKNIFNIQDFAKYKTSSFKPFDPVSKRTEITIEDYKNGNTLYNRGYKNIKLKISKGAPQVILSLLTNKKKEIKSKVESTVNDFALKGYRSIGVAISIENKDYNNNSDLNQNSKDREDDLPQQWQFVGIISLYDPPREDSKQTIKTARSMGVQVKMLTGDHIAIAKEIGKKLNLGTKITDASNIENKRDFEVREIVENVDGFAQVFPEHKYNLVEITQQQKIEDKESQHIVGMTGDGVNDAPALKKADIGIAVSGATDAAKAAASIVVTQPGLYVIIDAIKESRKIFQRMNNYVIYRLGETIRILLFLTFSIIAFNFYPVTPLMIVLLALLNDIPIMTIAYDKVPYSNKPTRWNMTTTLGISTALGLIGVISSFVILYIGLYIFDLNQSVIQSFIYLKLSVAGHLFLFVARTRDHFWTNKPGKYLFFAVVTTQIFATIIVVSGILLPAIDWQLALFVWIYSLIWFLISDFLKLPIYNLLEHKGLKFQQ